MKKLILILFIVGLLASFAFGAAQTCTFDNAGGNNLWCIAGNWATTVEADRVPIDGDAVIFDSADDCDMPSGTVPAAGAYSAWVMTDYSGTLEFIGSDIDVDGATVLGAGAAFTDSGTGSMTVAGNFSNNAVLPAGFTVILNGAGNVQSTDSGNLADLDIDCGANTVTANGDNYWASYTQSGGNITGTGQIFYLSGDLTYAGAGTVIGLTIEQTGTSNATWASAGDRFLEYRLGASAVITMTGEVQTKKLTFAAGSSLDAGSAKNLWVYAPIAGDFATLAGTIGSNVTVIIRLTADRSNSGVINSSGEVRLEADGADRTWTQSGVMDVASLELKARTDSFEGKLVIGVTSCDLGAVVLGTTSGTDRAGKLDLGNGAYAVAITSLAAGDSVPNELDFGDAAITLSGALNGTDITCIGEAASAGGAAVSGSGSSASISNVDMSSYEYLDARGIDGDSVADGGGNDNVRFARGLVGGGVF